MLGNLVPGKLLPKNLEQIWPWSKHQSLVGIDIGSSSIKAIQLRKEKEQAVLETYGELATGPYLDLAIGQAVRLPEDKLIEMLHDLFKEAGVNARGAVVSIPLKSSFLITIKLPVIPGKEMSEMIKFEARKYIPVSFEEVEMNWMILPPTLKNKKNRPGEEEEEAPKEEAVKAKQMADILLVAVYKETIQKYREIISKAGLKSLQFEIEVFSILRAALSRQTAPVMIIDFGASSTKMFIVDSGILRVAHTITKGSQDLTNTIARSLSITFDRAEEMKHQIGLSNRPEHKELISVMEPTLNIILAEARQLMLDYRRKYNESIGRVILTGGGSLLRNMVEFSVKNLGVEVSLADPFVKTNYPPFLQEVLKQAGPTFSSAMGLALRGL